MNTHPPTQIEASPTKRRSSWRTWLVLAGGLVFFKMVTSPPPLPQGWGNDYPTALVKAAEGDRKLIVAFHMPGCPPCSAMDRTVLGTPEVQRALSGLIPIHVNVVENPQVADRFGVFATPTYAVIDAQERLLDKREGYQSVEQFVSFIERASAMSSGDTPQAADARPVAP